MRLDDILSAAGKYASRKRIGRGIGSGHGKTSGRGHKGMGARAGSGQRMGYEGGQNPILARIPKRGFSNAMFCRQYQVVNVADLDRFDDGARVDAAILASAGLVDNAEMPVKVLGDGQITKKVTVVARKFSASAKQKIEQAGGSVEVV